MSGTQTSERGLNDPQRAEALLRDLVRRELQAAETNHLADGIGCTVRVRLPLDLLAKAKSLTGLEDTEQVLHAALVHLVMGSEADGGH